MNSAQTSQAGHHQLGLLELMSQRSVAVGGPWSLGQNMDHIDSWFHVIPSQKIRNRHLDSVHNISNATIESQYREYWDEIFICLKIVCYNFLIFVIQRMK